ncbi:alpha-L-rhamnosidase-related protein [Hyalangium gracile]|uniref:alpha-L-rhamnosidase-related protein n=1 Tax=Hyalangium gracile TaxID=394092 RepID=UPI001CCC3011|nr:alpha-L-rhamnosidase C-terminal domain-containing protein [Hyalangium gracile]
MPVSPGSPRSCLWLLLGALLTHSVQAAPAPTAASSPAPEQWTAQWIAVAGQPARAYGVYLLRRTFELPARPRAFRVHVSGDNRYQLFVNGVRVVRGPARGDVENWRYETVDIGPQLRAGRNVLAAVVWNYAEHSPFAQVSHRTGFVLQGVGAQESALVDSGPAWKAIRDEGFEVLPMDFQRMKTFYVAGPGDRLRADRHPWGWELPGFDDAAWPPAQVVAPAAAKGTNVTDLDWLLVPRTIPLMEERPERLKAMRRATGVQVPPGFPAQPAAVRVPARTRAELLLDQGSLTTAYLELVVSGGRGAKVELAYAENLWGADGKEKGHRDEVEGKSFRGNADELWPDGGTRRLFSPLWWRTWRYVRLTVETADEPLTLEDLRGVYTGYPFERRARFDARSSELEKILDVGWRTARLCAHETYMDCPYYEQIQYVGDTRVQALVSLYMSGDDRLMRNAIVQFNQSRTGDEPPMSRYPVSSPQYIPAFSLLWVGLVHDHWWYRGDPAFAREQLPGVRAVLSYFQRHSRPDGGLARLPYWGFVDWVDGWPGGVPPSWSVPPPWSKPRETFFPESDALGASSLFDLHLLLAYTWAAELERSVGDAALAEQHAKAAAALRATLRHLYWDEGRKLFADTAHRRSFSVHANALAVLADVVTGDEARTLLERALADTSLTRPTIYFRFYVHDAMRKAGLGDQYLDQLGPWRRMLSQGLTTWAETEDPSRSECHAWGASPNIELYRTVLGIDAAAPGWQRVSLRPALGSLPQASGTIPHPRGELSVAYAVRNGRLEARVQLPPGVPGELTWGGQTRALAPGRSVVTLEARAEAPR